jgi:hypothetical protein
MTCVQTTGDAEGRRGRNVNAERPLREGIGVATGAALGRER